MKLVYLFAVIIAASNSIEAQKKTFSPEIGVVQNLEDDSLLQAYGYRYLIESISKIISPRKVSEEQFQQYAQRINKLRIPLYACNIFIPGELKIVGPAVNEKAVMSYVDSVFQRCQAVGVKMIIWGSGGSRRVPEGFDPTKAKEQFVSIARKISERANKYKITFALENLNSTETNFITTVEEALDVVKKVDRENFRLCVDIYHMLKEGESATSIEKTSKYLIYCEIAERENRTPPGVKGDDFRPYIAALKKIGYKGKIVIECRWENIATQGGPAYQYLRKQIDEVYLN